MVTRFAVLPDDRRLLLGIDKLELFEAGYVYEATNILDTIVIKKLGKFALDDKGIKSDVNTQVESGFHLKLK